MLARFQIVPQRLPELESPVRSRKCRHDNLVVMSEDNGGIARIVRKAAYHVLHIICIHSAAHVRGEKQLEVAVQPVGGLKYFGRTTNVAGLAKPASGIESEAINAHRLGLLYLAFVGSDTALAGGVVGGIVLVGEHVVGEDQAGRSGLGVGFGLQGVYWCEEWESRKDAQAWPMPEDGFHGIKISDGGSPQGRLEPGLNPRLIRMMRIIRAIDSDCLPKVGGFNFGWEERPAERRTSRRTAVVMSQAVVGVGAAHLSTKDRLHRFGSK